MTTFELKPDNLLRKWFNEDFFIVDFEYTAWDGSLENGWTKSNEYREIVQMGAIKVINTDSNLILDDTLNILVKPSINPILSQYFIKLTGIEQNLVDKSNNNFEIALKVLKKFLNDTPIILCNGNDGEILRENCILNKIKVPEWTNNFYNFRPFMSKMSGINPIKFTSSDLPKLAGLTNSKKPHTGLDDCKSILRAFNYWKSIGKLK